MAPQRSSSAGEGGEGQRRGRKNSNNTNRNNDEGGDSSSSNSSSNNNNANHANHNDASHVASPLPSTSAPLDPATSAMVLSRLQNLSLPGSASYHPSQYAANPYPSSSSSLSAAAAAVPMVSGETSQTPPANVDVNAILASLSSGVAQFQTQAQHQPPAYVSASQLHPPIEAPAAEAAATSAAAARKKPASKAKASSARASSPSEDPNNTSVAKRVPPFLNKLRNMIDDEATNELICWQPEGRTFLVPNNIRFAKEVLPRFFKHNNFSSFVRQLNMYGFHKVPSLQQGSLKHEQEMEVWEFENENFVRDHPDLMTNVQRKPGHKGDGVGGERNEGFNDNHDEQDRTKALVDGKVEEGLNSVSGALMRTGDIETQVQLTNVWHAIQSIQSAQNSINDNLRHLTLSNDSLWQEAMESKRRSEQQSETINRMLRFLAGVFAGQDVLGGNHDPGSPSKGRKRGGQSGAGVGNGRGLFSGASSHPLMIQGSEASFPTEPHDPEGQGTFEEGDDNNERFHELFTRISETGSNENTPRGSRSPPDPTSSPKFTTLHSPIPGEGSGKSKSTSSRPSRTSFPDTPRRPSTPASSRGGKLAPQQLLSALQQMFAGNGGDVGGSVPGTPYGTRPGTPFGGRGGTPGIGASGSTGTVSPKMDSNILASLQSIMSIIQSQQGTDEASGSGSNDGSLGLYSQTHQTDDSNRFIYPYTGGPTGFTPPSSNSPVPIHAGEATPPLFPQSAENQVAQLNTDNSFAQYLQDTEADAESVQRAIGALVDAFRVPASEGRGSTPAPSPFVAEDGATLDKRNTNSGLADVEIAPGSWNRYTSPADSASPGIHGGTSRKSTRKSANNGGDIDMDALLSQFIDSSASGANEVEEGSGTATLPGQSEEDVSTPVANTTRQKRKSLDAQGDATMNPLEAGQSTEEGATGGGQKRKKTNNDTRGGGGGGGGVMSKKISGKSPMKDGRRFGQTSVEDG